ncbi:protein toll [Culicoides brevitarsis]|uniref:protein toll n=1 Tax=Culicoides brevitarsis TaxID=469753 RepID=UPI00307BE0DA
MGNETFIILVVAVIAACIMTTETYPQATFGTSNSGLTTIDMPLIPRFVCPEGDYCTCDNMSPEYEIQCPRIDPHVHLRILQPAYIMVQCFSYNETAYEEIPRMNLGEIQKLHFQQCPLPQGRSLHSIAEHFNASRIRTLIFQMPSYAGNVRLHRAHLSGFQHLQRLSITDNTQTELPSDLFDDLGTLNWLQLKSGREYLPQDIFSKLPNLQVIELAMKLREFNPKMFVNQKNIRTLNLWGNRLSNLSKDSFENLASVVEMDLSSNGLETLNVGIFDPLRNLMNLNLNANNFSSLPENLLAQNTEMHEFRMLNNRQQLKALPAALLANKPKLNKVLIRADVEELPEDLFAGSKNIVTIGMDGNKLQKLPPKLLQDQSELQELDLKHNQLVHLDEYIFAGTRSLRIVHLSYNQLLNISSNVFAHLENLMELYLDHNNLHTIGSHAFHENIEKLHLQFNRLTFREEFKIRDYEPTDDDEYTQSLGKLKNLRELRLDHNLIETIFGDWTLNMLSLEELDLSNNHISYLSAEHLQFSQNSLRVNLSNNQIEKIDLHRMTLIAENNSKRNPTQVFLGSNPLNCNCFALSLVQLVKDNSQIRNFIDFEVDQLRCSAPQMLRGRNVKEISPFELVCKLDDVHQGKERYCPEGCDCQVRPVDRTALVNCSNAGLNDVPQLFEPSNMNISIHHMELDLSGNFINELPDASMVLGYNSISKLLLDHNNISSLYAENIPKNVKYLTLDHNNLQWMNVSVLDQLNHTKSLEKVFLSENPWTCDCTTLEFLVFVQSQHEKIGDYERISCSNGMPVSKMVAGDFCSEENLAVILIAVIIALFSIFIAIAALLYIKYSQEIKVWLFAKGWLLWLISEDEIDEDKKYDAFISFSQHDEDLVAEYLVPELESGEFPYKLCIHFRDWIVGDVIADQVTRSVNESRKTIVILSPNFLTSVWGQAEFRQAHNLAVKEGLSRVIMILYGDIGPVEKLDPELQAYLKTNTYLTWGDQWFWRKLRYALRHPISMRGQNKHGLVKSSMKTSVDDKLELIIPSPVTPTLTTPPAESANNSLITKLASKNAKNHGNGHLPNNNKFINGGYIPNNGYNGSINGHVNGAFIINTNAKQSDV